MTLYFDIDEVVRSISSVFYPECPTDWMQKTPTGKTVEEAVGEDLTICETAPRTQYLTIINVLLDEVHFVSAQPKSWRPYTDNWLRKNVIPKHYVVYVDHAEEKFKYVRYTDDYLVDDYPNFKDYSKVFIVDRLYNKHVNSAISRISNEEHLMDVIQRYGDIS
jgi:hypothetical protein